MAYGLPACHAWAPAQGLRSRMREVETDQMALEICLTGVLLQLRIQGGRMLVCCVKFSATVVELWSSIAYITAIDEVVNHCIYKVAIRWETSSELSASTFTGVLVCVEM